MRARLFGLLMLCSALPAAAEQPEDYARRFTIEHTAGTALQRLELGDDVYRALRRHDLGDLQVFNAAGEHLPMARLPAERPAGAVVARVPLTRLPTRSDDDTGSTRIRVERAARDTRLSVELGDLAAAPGERLIADLANFRPAVHAVELPLPPELDFEGRLRIETSEDLLRWHTLTGDAPVLAVGRGAERIARTRVELAGRVARYLRLTWLESAPSPHPVELILIHQQQATASPRFRWLRLEGRASGDHFEYLAPGRYPVDQLRWVPASGNDLLAARVESRQAVSARWQFRAHSVGFRLEADGQVREGVPVAFATTRDPLWRLVPERALLAGAAPLLELAWAPEEIVFLARGAPPYQLAVGHPDRAPVWLSISELVPGYGSDNPVPIASARLAAHAATPPAMLATSLWQPGRHWWLWAALLLGVAVLGWMARRVWHELQHPDPRR